MLFRRARPDIEFDERFYGRAYPDVRSLPPEARYSHWRQHGRGEGRTGSWGQLLRSAFAAGIQPRTFDAIYYYYRNPDLGIVGIDTAEACFIHYLEYGRLEGRLGAVAIDAHLSEIRRLCRPCNDDTWATAPLGDIPLIPPEYPSLAAQYLGWIESALAFAPCEDVVVALHRLGRGHTPNSHLLDSIVAELDGWECGRTKYLAALDVGAFGCKHPSLHRADAPVASLLDPENPAWEVEEPTALDLFGYGFLEPRDWFKGARPSPGPVVKEAPARRELLSPRMTELPRISVIASLFRSEKYLKQYLASLVEQTIFDEVELCLVLVTPNDREVAIVEDSGQRHSNIRWESVQSRIGIYEAWNIAVRMSNGEYVTNANDDDVRHPDSLAQQAAILDMHPWVDVVYQDFLHTLDPTLSWAEMMNADAVSDLPHVTLPGLLSGINPPHNAPMWRRSLHEKVGLFNENYRSASDWEFWIRCAAHGSIFMKSRKPTVAYFTNPEGMSTRQDSPGALEAEEIYAANSHRLTYGARPAGTADPSRMVQLRRAERVTLGALAELRRLRAEDGES